MKTYTSIFPPWLDLLMFIFVLFLGMMIGYTADKNNQLFESKEQQEAFQSLCVRYTNQVITIQDSVDLLLKASECLKRTK